MYGRVPWRDKNDAVLFDMITTTPVDTLFDTDVKISEDYKKFITDCLTIDFNKRATPEHIINYEWPLAREYIEGVEDNQRQSSVGLPLNVRAVNRTQLNIKEK